MKPDHMIEAVFGYGPNMDTLSFVKKSKKLKSQSLTTKLLDQSVSSSHTAMDLLQRNKSFLVLMPHEFSFTLFVMQFIFAKHVSQ